MRLVEGGDRPRLRPQPDVVTLGPGLLGGGEAATVPQEEFRQPMSGPKQVGTDVFAAAQQIASRFFVFGGDVDRRQGASAIQDGELARIAPIGLDAIAGPARNQSGGNHVAGDGPSGERAL
jgi:hypothetical protein